MNKIPKHIQSLIPEGFHSESRIWIYQSHRKLNADEKAAILQAGKIFARDWTAHKVALHADFFVLADCFLVLIVDETQAGASGCSIDTSVRFIRGLEQEYSLRLMDRTVVAWLDGENVELSGMDSWKQMAAEGKVDENTLIFNQTLTRLGELDTKWLQAAGISWLKKIFQTQGTTL